MWEQKKETKPECVDKCGKHMQPEIVYLDYYVMAKIDFLMEKYKNLEWLAYLIGKDNVVEDIYIPEQQVTSSNVTDIKGDPNIAIIGVIHSHHNLGLHNFSGTDHAYINDNHDLSILVWNTGISGQKRVKLACGAVMIAPIQIKYFHPELNIADLEKEADDNISEKKWVTPMFNGFTGYSRTYQFPTETEKKSSNINSEGWQGNGPNPATGKDEEYVGYGNYEKYLDQLVYDNSFMGCEEDMPTEDEIEAHFQRIEEREGIVSISKKVGVGQWEV